TDIAVPDVVTCRPSAGRIVAQGSGHVRRAVPGDAQSGSGVLSTAAGAKINGDFGLASRGALAGVRRPVGGVCRKGSIRRKLTLAKERFLFDERQNIDRPGGDGGFVAIGFIVVGGKELRGFPRVTDQVTAGGEGVELIIVEPDTQTELLEVILALGPVG